MDIGVAISGGAPPQDVLAIAARAEQAGVNSVWIAEGAVGDAFALLAGIAGVTNRIRLGTAVVSVYSRSLPTLAMAAATVADLSKQRFVLGIGPSHKEQVEGEHGLQYYRPMQHVRDAVAAVRQLSTTGVISGPLATAAIDTFTSRMQLPAVDIPIVIGANGPKMLELSGEIADGVVLVWRTPSEVAEIVKRLAPQSRVSCLLPTGTADSSEAAEAAIAAAQGRHGRFANYRRVFDQQDAAGALVATTAAQLEHGLAAYEEAGLDEAILMPITLTDEPLDATVTHLLSRLQSAGRLGDAS